MAYKHHDLQEYQEDSRFLEVITHNYDNPKDLKEFEDELDNWICNFRLLSRVFSLEAITSQMF